ncbi:hypothetical protein QE152_g39693, partial [Popillia japonica]
MSLKDEPRADVPDFHDNLLEAAFEQNQRAIKYIIIN